MVIPPSTILESFWELKLISLSAVLDDGNLYKDIPAERAASAN